MAVQSALNQILGAGFQTFNTVKALHNNEQVPEDQTAQTQEQPAVPTGTYLAQAQGQVALQRAQEAVYANNNANTAYTNRIKEVQSMYRRLTDNE